MFADYTVEIHGDWYDWSYAYEDGVYHTDYYYCSATSEEVVVYGLINTTLALASGNGVNGYFQGGGYNDITQEYTSEYGQFDIGGFIYDYHEYAAYTEVNLESNIVRQYGYDNYTGQNDTYYCWWDPETGWHSNEYHHIDGLSPDTYFYGTSYTDFNLFGANYLFESRSLTWTRTWDDWTISGTYSQTTTDTCTSPDGGVVHLTTGYSDGYGNYGGLPYPPTNPPDVSWDGWDPYVGAFSGVTTSMEPDPVFEVPRTSPSFAPAQIWVEGNLYNWQEGTIVTDGLVTDLYAGDSQLSNVVITAYARDFANGGSADVTFVGGGEGGTYSDAGGFTDSRFQTSLPQTTYQSPLFYGSTLWVNGTEYAFDEGYGDAQGNRTDNYVNGSAGLLTLSGFESDTTTGSVAISYLGNNFSGTFDANGFSVAGCTVSVYPPGPPAFWVRGALYLRTSPESLEYVNAATSASLTLSGEFGQSLILSGTDARGSFSGTYSEGQGGILLLNSTTGGAAVPVVPANEDGTLRFSAAAPPQGLPPAIAAPGSGLFYLFLGVGTNMEQVSTEAAYYGCEYEVEGNPQPVRVFLLISINTSDGTMTDWDLRSTHLDYMNHAIYQTFHGAYNFQSHLIQANDYVNGYFGGLYPVDPNANFSLWGIPPAPQGLPSTLLVHGQVWRYTHSDSEGNPVYEGYFVGQQLTLGEAGPGGHLMTIVDPVNGDTIGVLNDLRGAGSLPDGSIVYSGNYDGQRVDPILPENQLQTIAADLDITGNILSFGALSDNPSSAGVTFQFEDLNSVGTLHTLLGRPLAEWTWWKAGSVAEAPPQQVMHLDMEHVLTLYDPGSNQPGIVLDPRPNGASSIKGVLRVPESGDISMGQFTNGPQP